MKALEKSIYAEYEVCQAFNKISLSDLGSYNATKKEQLKSYLEDLHNGGCMSDMISEFIYHSDCKKFYIENLGDWENIREEIEDSLGKSVKIDIIYLITLLCADSALRNTVFDIYRYSLNNLFVQS